MLSKIDILGSSSDGNAYVLSFDNKVKVQLDAGVKNPKANEIDLCCVSHEHIDHNKYIKDFSKEQCRLYDYTTCGDTFISTQALTVTAFKVPHEVKNYGFMIDCDDERVLYITDCDYSQLDIEDIECYDPTVLMIECNWDKFLIDQGEIKRQSYSDYALKNHMSNLDCLNLISELKISKNCKIIFLHKSRHHATYENTYKMFDSLPNKKYIAKEGETLYVKSWKAI